jgi:hypothetical protein
MSDVPEKKLSAETLRRGEKPKKIMSLTRIYTNLFN